MMKWRQSVIYLLILLLAGGYFFYFEVIRKEKKEEHEKETKRLFHIAMNDVEALEIHQKDRPAVSLVKEDAWRIDEPIQTGVDKFGVDSALNTLSNLRIERDIVAAAGDLKPFGLSDPILIVRFKGKDQWYELQFGDKNPVGDGYYAKTGDKPAVFLISEGNWGVLNKGLDELRRKDLFTFSKDEVTALQVEWDDGASVRVEKGEESVLWKAPAQPDLSIKASKVLNVLEQVHWLKARNFLRNDPEDLQAYGLEPAHVMLTLILKPDRTVTLRLAKKSAEKKTVAALSSELPSVVEVDAVVLRDLPRELSALEDRSITGVGRDRVKSVKWSLAGNQGDVVRGEKDQWVLKSGEKTSEPLKNPWVVQSLLWDLDNTEYRKKLDPALARPDSGLAELQLWGDDAVLVTLTWRDKGEPVGGEGAAEGDGVPVWVERNGRTSAVELTREGLERIIDAVRQIGEKE